MLLGRDAIIKAMEVGSVVISPFNPRQLGTNSYDVRLGPWYYRINTLGFHVPLSTRLAVYEPFNEDHAKSLFQGPFRNEDFIELAPRETVLAATMEFVGGKNGILADMRCRSSIRRNFTDTNAAAGLGDVGYIAPWTIELVNDLPVMVRWPIGARVGQMVFWQTIGGDPGQYQGKYGQEATELREWKPEDMLPKNYRDWDWNPRTQRIEFDRTQYPWLYNMTPDS